MALWSNTDEESSKPKYLSDTLRNDQQVTDKAATYGVDAQSPNWEAQQQVNRDKGIKTPGWVQYHTYTDAQGNTRHKAETLVAFGAKSMTGDAADDSVVQDD